MIFSENRYTFPDHALAAVSFRDMPGAIIRKSVMTDFDVAQMRGTALAHAQKEKDQLSLAQSRGKTPCDRPDPDDPGGLGAEESGTERTGSTQNSYLN